MKGLGRLYNAISSPTTTGTYVSLQDASTMTIFAVGASNTTNVTVTVAKDASGTGAITYGSTTPAASGDGITVYWTQHNGVWTKNTQAAAGTFPTLSATGDISAAEIDDDNLPDGFKYVKASHANATLVIVLGDLEVQRIASNLRNPTV